MRRNENAETERKCKNCCANKSQAAALTRGGAPLAKGRMKMHFGKMRDAVAIRMKHLKETGRFDETIFIIYSGFTTNRGVNLR